MDTKKAQLTGLVQKPGLKKREITDQLAHEILQHNNLKKRCNLYVKNFSVETTEEDLRNIFYPYGEIESLKLFAQKDDKSPFALVCFTTAGTASQVKKAKLHIDQRPLHINYYEMKQPHDILNETNQDNQDWQRQQAEDSQSFEDQVKEEYGDKVYDGVEKDLSVQIQEISSQEESKEEDTLEPC